MLCVIFSNIFYRLMIHFRIWRSQEQSSAKSKKRPPLRRGKVSPQLPVPEHIPRPSYVGSKGLPELCKGQFHDAQGIAGIRAACKLAARVLDFAGTLVKVNLFICRWLNLSMFSISTVFFFYTLIISHSFHSHLSHQLPQMKSTLQCIIWSLRLVLILLHLAIVNSLKVYAHQ